MNRPDFEMSRNWLRRLRLYFFTGLAALAPIAVTAYILWLLFSTVDSWLSGALEKVPFLTVGGRPLPGLGFITVIVIVILAGIITRNIVGRQMLSVAEMQFSRIPMVRSIYGGAKQLVQAIFGNKRAIFQKVVLVPFPTRGVYAVAFYTSDSPPEVLRKTQEDMISVFMPTTPNPTSGYLLIVRRTDAIPLDMSIEEAIKFVISGGAVIPEDRLGELMARRSSEPIATT
jgi:uncharacterized membrane protein